MSNANRIRLQVIDASSEDPDYPASQLNEVSPTTKGWQSARFCTYPQELGFEFLDGETRVTQIQILSHQSKIASKVEIFVGKGSNYDTAHFKRLGYLSLDSNERSNYQARELKTVFIDCVGSFLKLLVFENHVNKVNMYNQVGIVAISLQSDPDEAVGPKGGQISKPSAKPVYQNPYNDLTVDINLDPTTAQKLRQLAEAKAKAIANEDYGTAKAIKVVEQDLKTMGARLAQLDMAKAEAVIAEDYDLAKDIKEEGDQLRAEIETRIRHINIPGVSLASSSSRKPAPRSTAGAKVEEEELHVQRSSPRSSAFDETPVGGGGGGSTKAPPNIRMESFNAAGKKAVKVELVDHPGFEEHDAKAAAAAAAGSGDDDGDDRPIRPKATQFYDDQEDASGAVLPASHPVETFPPGQHPLEGVPGFLELPPPEPLSTLNREYAETTGIVRVFGEYLAKCLYSKSWNVREGAMIKVNMLLTRGEVGGDVAGILPALAGVLKIGAEDKIQQVLFSSLTLMESVLKDAKSAKLPRSQCVPLFDPVMVQLVDKLADGNARLREGGRKGLELLAASAVVGAQAVSGIVTRPLPPKQKTGWRPLATRLEVLTMLAQTYGVQSGGSGSGVSLDMLLRFPKDTQAFAHSNKEVRDAAKDLVVAIQAQVGTAPLEPTLDLLRKNQKEEYLQAFEQGKGGKGGGSAGGAGAKEVRGEKAQHGPSHNAAGAKVPTSSHKVQQHKEGYDLPAHNHSPAKKKGGNHDDGADGQATDFTSCMFCGEHNKAWTENDLDLHYWKDCPLLISCPSCAQIVEIAGLPEHLLDECDEKKNYVPCDVTGLAIRANEFDSWNASPKCRPAPPNSMYCPLCIATVEDSDEAWMTHLTKKCSKNTRIQTT